MVGSLTVLPAMLSKLGDRVEKGRVPFLARAPGTPATSRASGRAILDRVLRRPVVVARRSPAALLVALAIPALGMHTADPGVAGPAARPAGRCKTYDRIQAAFPGGAMPAVVVVQRRRRARRRRSRRGIARAASARRWRPA